MLHMKKKKLLRTRVLVLLHIFLRTFSVLSAFFFGQKYFGRILGWTQWPRPRDQTGRRWSLAPHWAAKVNFNVWVSEPWTTKKRVRILKATPVCSPRRILPIGLAGAGGSETRQKNAFYLKMLQKHFVCESFHKLPMHVASNGCPG